MGQNKLLEREPRVSSMQIESNGLPDDDEESINVVIEWRISDPSAFANTIKTCEKWIQLNKFQLSTFAKTKADVMGWKSDLQLNTILQLWFDEYYDYYREKFGVCLINVYLSQQESEQEFCEKN